MSSPKAPRKRKRPAAQNQRAQGSRPRWRQGAADKDNDDDGARSSDRPRSSPTGGRLLRCRRWTVVCPPRLAVASGPFHAAIVDLNIRARRLSQRPEVRIGRRYRNAIVNVWYWGWDIQKWAFVYLGHTKVDICVFVVLRMGIWQHTHTVTTT